MGIAVHKGRGAVSDLPGRFESRSVEINADIPEVDSRPETVLSAMSCRSIVSENNSPDINFDRSINPYIGCEHGCVYCYARPSHSYLDLSPGIDFETKIFYKPDAPARLLETWERPGYQCKPIAIGANTDPYQPAEKKLGLTRELLMLFLRHRHPVSIISKGTLMLRDIDILAALAKENLVSVALSVPTADNGLKRILEPRIPTAKARFELMQALTDANIPVTLLLAPVIPAINDSEIEAIIEQAGNAGASHAAWILLRLPHELKALFREWLQVHFPDRAEHVMSLVRQASGGQDYDNRFGIRQRGSGPYAKMLATRFRAACRRYGISNRRDSRELETRLFRRPGQHQMTLGFD